MMLPLHSVLLWDSEMLGLNCGSVAVGPDLEDNPDLAQTLLATIPESEELTVVKLPTSHPTTLKGLLKTGAKHLGTEITFRFSGEASALRTDERTRILDHCDSTPLLPLADEMRHSRFSLDDLIPQETAIALWRESINNHCRGRASALAVGYEEETPAGLIAALDNDDKRTLFLVGVLPRHQGAGLGLDMIRAIVAHAGARTVRVEAFKANIPAVKLYEKAGFVRESEHAILHIWQKKRK